MRETVVILSLNAFVCFGMINLIIARFVAIIRLQD